MKNFFYVLKMYVYSKRKLIIFLLLFYFCFVIVFFLYQLPLEPILYGTLISVYFTLIVGGVNIYKLYIRYQQLQTVKKQITFQIDQLPNPLNFIEQQYQEIIHQLFSQQKEITLMAEEKQTDLINYFTQWTHQIKTPIAAIRLLLQTDANKANQELEMELFKIERYVEFVLQYLRVDDMTHDLEIKHYSIDDIIKQALRKYAKVFIRKKISLHFEESGCQVLTDEKWLLFVIEQILSNALKYTNKGSISITMDTSDNKKLLIIKDTGIGIRQEDLPRIFEKGFTGYNGRIFKQATGMGLFLSKEILKKLSHEIFVESEVGKGTTVTIDLSTEHIEIE